MNRIERDKQRSRMKKQIDDIMRNNPEYARRHKEEQEDNVMRAFRTFILISVDYLERFCGFGNKRINRYLDFVNQSVKYVEDDPEYFVELAKEMKKELASEQLIEELADVLVAADAVGIPIFESCDNSKWRRWAARIRKEREM